MDDHKTLQALEALHEDEREIPLVVRLWDILMIFETVTLTVTHPNVDEYAKFYYTELGRQLQTYLIQELPNIEPLLKACWNRQLNLTDDPVLLNKRKRWAEDIGKRYKRKTGRM